jgi:hypothetical protein
MARIDQLEEEKMSLNQKNLFLVLLMGLLFVLITGCVGYHQVVHENQTNTPTVSTIITLVQGKMPEKIFIAQSEEAVRKFANISDQNVAFKGITNESYADLFEFESGNSSFWVNNVTGRVQYALWHDERSNAEKEIIDLDEGSIIAESYAKEKYPELWNISDKKGIKQTVERINDGGIYRTLEYSWQETFYNPDKNTTSQSEIPGQNHVYITISPYTGHIFTYDEWYNPTESFPNLTSTIPEEQARMYAASYFQSTGITDIQQNEIKSYGLHVGFDQENNQRLIWDFALTRKNKLGIDEGGGVGIDAYDGTVVWSSSFG